MKREYLKEEQARRKTTKQGIIVIIIFVVIFIGVIFRFAFRSGSTLGLLPTPKDAYEIAKDYVKPTIKSQDVEFPDDYQYTKSSDSLYVIKSYFEASNIGGQNAKTDFTITLKYNGGFISRDADWTVVNLVENDKK
jgi:hypothetical protein